MFEFFFFFSSRRRHTRSKRDWSSDVCSSDLSAGALRFPAARFDAVRCGIAIYGLSPFGTDPADDALDPALLWQSQLAQVRQLGTGETTGYGRTFVAERPTWIGIVPVGYADGFR